ncbi:MAG: carbamoyltransferase HypF, partial [Paramuribaculum sp.]|nr:carbamoyltransferase HypF [Paramuribaculum sp.]
PAYPINVIRPLDLSPLLRAILVDLEAGTPVSVIAARFHSTYAEIWYRVILEASMRSGLRRVVLSGGVMQNALLVSRLVKLLEGAGLKVFLPENVCLGDACIAVGQVAHAAAVRTFKSGKDA